MTIRYLSMAGALLLGSLASLRADYSTTFVDPPYTLGQTVIGVEGWEQRTLDGAETDASLEAAPWDASSTALKMYSTSEGNSSQRRTRIGNRFSESSEENPASVRITLALAFEWANSASNTSSVVFFNDGTSATPSDTNVPFTLGFAVNSSTGGLYVVDGNETTSILSIADMKQGARYSFLFDLDFNTNTFDLLVTGVDVDDQPFSFSRDDLAFQADIDRIGSVYLFNNRGDIMTLYTESIAVEAVPEPSTVALLTGGLLVGAYLLRRSRGQRQG